MCGVPGYSQQPHRGGGEGGQGDAYDLDEDSERETDLSKVAQQVSSNAGWNPTVPVRMAPELLAFPFPLPRISISASEEELVG